jgi:hypothetical protein
MMGVWFAMANAPAVQVTAINATIASLRVSIPTPHLAIEPGIAGLIALPQFHNMDEKIVQVLNESGKKRSVAPIRREQEGVVRRGPMGQ